MTVYSKLYADFQQRSCLPVTSNAAGHERWFTPLVDSGFNNAPTVLLATEIGLVAQSVNRIALISYDGFVEWVRHHGSGLSAVYADSVVYFQGAEGDLYAVDATGQTVVSGFFVPTVTDRGFIYVAMPLNRQKILLHTFNRAEEPEPGDPPQSANYQILLMGTERYDDWDWMHEFEGNCLPALVTLNHDRVVLLTDTGDVHVFDVSTGDRAMTFDLPGVSLLQASIDNDNNLVLALVTADGRNLLCCHDLFGRVLWEYELEIAERHVFHEPPAIGPDNCVLYIAGDDLFVVNAGAVVWTAKVTRAERRFVTVLADGTVLVAAASVLVRYDREGSPLFTITLEPDEIITAPPVVSQDGRVHIATVRGIHSFD